MPNESPTGTIDTYHKAIAESSSQIAVSTKAITDAIRHHRENIWSMTSDKKMFVVVNNILRGYIVCHLRDIESRVGEISKALAGYLGCVTP